MFSIFGGWGALLAIGMPVAFTLYAVSIIYLLLNGGIALSATKSDFRTKFFSPSCGSIFYL